MEEWIASHSTEITASTVDHESKALSLDRPVLCLNVQHKHKYTYKGKSIIN
jgi:hypothetical protein